MDCSVQWIASCGNRGIARPMFQRRSVRQVKSLFLVAENDRGRETFNETFARWLQAGANCNEFQKDFHCGCVCYKPLQLRLLQTGSALCSGVSSSRKVFSGIPNSASDTQLNQRVE